MDHFFLTLLIATWASYLMVLAADWRLSRSAAYVVVAIIALCGGLLVAVAL